MRTRWLIAVCLGTAAMAQEADQNGILVPRAVGVAALGDDLAATRDRALLDAQRHAVEAALGVAISSKSKIDLYELIEDKVSVESVRGVCFAQEILEEKRDDAQKSYLITIRCRVATRPLVVDVAQQLPELYEHLERPRLVLLINEKKADGSPGQAISTALSKLLLERGFDVVDQAQLDALGDRAKVQQALQGNPEAEAWLATSLDAEILVKGAATAAAGGCDAQVRVLNAYDAKLLAAATAQSADAEGVARKLVPAKAGKDDLIAQILASWLARPTQLTLVMANAKYNEVRDLVKRLQPFTQPREVDMTKPSQSSELPRFSGARMRNYNPKLSKVEVESPLRRMAAIEAVEQIMTGLGYEITGVNGLLLDLAPKAK